MSYMSAIIIGLALSPRCPLLERTFAVAWFPSNREGSAAFIGYSGDFQTKGLKLNVRGDKALSASNCTLSLVGCSQAVIVIHEHWLELP